jgi:hypothetical protein
MRAICKRSKWGKYGSVSLRLYGFENGPETLNAVINAVNVMDLREALDAMQRDTMQAMDALSVTNVI